MKKISIVKGINEEGRNAKGTTATDYMLFVVRGIISQPVPLAG
jgi:hypothetical protein